MTKFNVENRLSLSLSLTNIIWRKEGSAGLKASLTKGGQVS